jgi:hypothetical protein
MPFLCPFSEAGSKAFFFEKKKQKTFVRCRGQITSTQLKK